MIRLSTSQPRARNLDDKIIPLINVIFLLLIFFMISGSLTELEREGVTPPFSNSAAVSGESESEWLLRTDGVIIAEGQEYTLQQLEEWLSRSNVVLPRSQQLRADSNVPARLLLPVMEVLQQRGVERLMLVTISERSDK